MAFLIALTGILFYGSGNMTEIPQGVYFVFCAGIILSMVLYRYSRIIAAMMGWFTFVFAYTIFFRNVETVCALDAMLTGLGCGCIYLATRILNTKEDVLKWFLIPACINILFIFVQQFFPSISPIRSEEPTGLLGNAGLTATYLAMTAPIFMRYWKYGLLPLFLAICFCKGFVGMAIFFTSWIIYYFGHNKKLWRPAVFVLAIGFLLALWHDPLLFKLRLSMWTGTFDGIFRHPFIGWGMGSFVDVVSKVPTLDSYHFGMPFNNAQYMMNHPANEFLFGWWNCGLPFVLLMIILSISVIAWRSERRVLPFCILIGGLITSLGFMFKPPTLFLFILALGIYENMIKEDNNERKESFKSEYANI